MYGFLYRSLINTNNNIQYNKMTTKNLKNTL